MLLFSSLSLSFMKKLLYLIPLALLVLNAMPLAVYKNTVNYSPNSQSYHLSPSYWRQLEMKVPKPAFSQSTVFLSSGGTLPSAVPLSKGAQFYGFPAGFYFKKVNVLNYFLPNVPYTVTAFSWLWATADGLIIVITLAAALWFNRRRPSQTSDAS